jgi:hypothetical protein
VQWEPEPLEDFDVNTVMARLANLHDRRGEGPKLAQAVVFLRQFLGVGPRPAKDVRMTARAVSIAEQTLRRAAEKLSVKQHNPGSGQVWQLPPSQPIPQDPWAGLVVVEGSTTKQEEELEGTKADTEVAEVTPAALLAHLVMRFADEYRAVLADATMDDAAFRDAQIRLIDELGPPLATAIHRRVDGADASGHGFSASPATVRIRRSRDEAARG